MLNNIVELKLETTMKNTEDLTTTMLFKHDIVALFGVKQLNVAEVKFHIIPEMMSQTLGSKIRN